MIKSAPEIKINGVDFNGNVTRMSCSQDLQASGRASLSLALGHDDSCPKIGEEVEISHRGRTLFVGPIIGANISINVTPTGAKQEFAELEVANFLYPLTTAEIRRTPIAKEGRLKEISDKALMESLKENPILNLVKKSLKREDARKTLALFLEEVGDEYPSSFLNLENKTEFNSNLVAVPEDNEDAWGSFKIIKNDVVKGQPHPKSFAGAYTATHNTVWSLITQTFAPHPLFELFPIILPSELSPFYNLALVYRYKPVDPNLYKAWVNTLGIGTKYYQKWFNATPTVPDYQRINTPIISMSLMYNDMDRMNAVHHSLPHEAEGSADNLLFGVQGVPVVNIEDINRFGLRASTFPTPFISLDDKKQDFHRYAPSAFSERTYLTFGEGEKYAIARVVIEYDETLLPGVWVEIDEYVGYVTEVMHDININNRGMLSGFTSLSLERVQQTLIDYRPAPLMNPTFGAVPLKKREVRPKGKNTKKSQVAVQGAWSVTDDTPQHQYTAQYEPNAVGMRIRIFDDNNAEPEFLGVKTTNINQTLFSENGEIIFSIEWTISGNKVTFSSRNIDLLGPPTIGDTIPPVITMSEPILNVITVVRLDQRPPSYIFGVETVASQGAE